MKIINIASGKGGTGKTLIAAMLSNMLSTTNRTKVLVVDMDIFVRGLTSLLYLKHDKKRRLLETGRASVSDIIAGISDYDNGILLDSEKIGIDRFRDFDIWPSVSMIDEILDHKYVVPSNYDVAFDRVKYLIDSLMSFYKKYDFVILDSRSGYDELTAATHSLSDVTISVEDGDQVSRITANNLINQLSKTGTTPIYRLIHKSDGGSSVDSDEIGRIPFDVDIMHSYGSDEFWINIKKSMLGPALADAWNKLSDNENFDVLISSSRINPIQIGTIERRLSGISLVQRVTFIYGLLISIGGFIVAFGGYEIIRMIASEPIRLASLGAGIIGLVTIFITFLKPPSK